MIKKIFSSMIFVFILIVLTSCINKVVTFNATIMECNKNSMIVKPYMNEEEYKSSDKFIVSFDKDYKKCNVGNKVKIMYDGIVKESYPAGINAIKIENIK